MVVVTDADRRVTWVNQTYTAVTGWTLDEVRGLPAGARTHGPLTDKRVTEQLGNTLRQGRSVSGVEVVNYRKSGEPYTLLLNIEPVRNIDREVIAYFSIQMDVTERRKLEKSNAQLQYHLQAAQRLLKLGLVKFDRVTQQLKWTSEINEIFEIDKSTTGGSLGDLRKFVAIEALPELQERIDKSLATGEEFDHDFPIVTTNGHRRWVRVCGVPERQDRNWRGPETWTIQDISVYKELYEQKRLNNEKLRIMVGERTTRLEEANRSLEVFSHALSHDLKKPVRHMASFSEIVKSSIVAGDVDAAMVYCDKVISAGNRLSSLIDGMLAFSRLGRKGIHCCMVDMRKLTTECIGEVSASFPSQAFTASGVDDLPVVWADPVLTREVWSNLLDNAFKYSGMREVTCLNFASVESVDGWTLSIRDNGLGIEAGDALDIFGMFTRVDADASISGDGIGLAMCKRIIQSHGGRIWVESAQQEGSTFCVYLPRTAPSSGFGEI